jgi:outer membrane cobalamin receptor
MMQKLCINIGGLLIFLLALPFAVYAHKGMINGTVHNRVNGEPMVNVSVAIEGTTKSTVSDAMGRFSMTGLQDGSCNLVISYVGFEQELITAEVDEVHPVTLSVSLNPSGLKLAEVSVSSTKRPDINRVSEVDFRLRPVRTTQDLLRNMPGLFIAQHAGSGKAEQIFLRGFDIDHGTDINITVDGMPVNMVSHAHGQGYADLHFVIPETVESFQFGKGPYYADIGDFGTAGYVSFKTKNALEQSLVKVEAGNFNTQRIVGLLKLPIDKSNTRKNSGYVGGEYFQSDGPYESSQDFKRYNALAKYNLQINERNRINLSASYFYSKWDASGQIPERAVANNMISRFGSLDNTEGGDTRRINANVQLTSELNGGATWNNQFYFVNYNFNLYSNFTFFLEDTVNGDQIHQKESRNIAGFTSSLSKEGHIGAKPLSMSFGAGVRYDLVDDVTLEKTKARNPLGDIIALGDVRQVNTFAWWNNSLQLLPKLTLNAAARFDNISYSYADHLANTKQRTSASRVSPKLSMYYLPSKNTKLFLNAGYGFHSNDARVAVPQNGKQVMPPAFGVDLGTTVKAFEKLIISASLWTLYLEQEFVYVGDAGIVEAGGKTVRRGVDLSFRYQALPWLYADVDLNYAHARNAGTAITDADKYIPLAPNLTSIGGITAEFKNGVKGALRYRYIADRPANENNSVIAKGYFINDLLLSYTRKQFEYTMAIENLFDINWNEAQFDTESRLAGEVEPVSELHYTPGTPFSIRFGISYRF